MSKKEDQKNILDVKYIDRYKTIDELFKGLFSNSVYYTLLFLSAVVVSGGVLLNNIPIIVGGMLITPMLTPLLIIALSLSVGSFYPIKIIGVRFLSSLFVIAVVAFLLASFLGVGQDPSLFNLSSRSLFLYLLVATASGVAATFAWAHKEISEILPGVAISVSLLPPLALIGIWSSVAEWSSVFFFLSVFTSNTLGIILGSFVVFKILGFEHNAQKVENETEEVGKENGSD